MGCGAAFFGGNVAEKLTHLDDRHDRVVEHYEMPALIERIQSVLDVNGVLTVADYRRELAAARNDAQEHSASYDA